jgi:DNA polymerase III subunit epsilon
VWIAGGRVVDWGPVGGDPRDAEGVESLPALPLPRELALRSARALSAAPAPGKLGGWLPADAVAEARLVGAWIVANRPPALELGARTGEAAHAAFLARAGLPTAASSTG